MKKILIIAIAILFVTNTFAQTNYTPVGTWKYINGLDTLEMFFKIGELTSGTVSFPVIKGYHRYVKNGQVVENYIPFVNSVNKYSILIYNNHPTMARLDGNIKDLTLNYKRYIILKKVNPTTISVTLTSYEGWQRNSPPNNSYTLPRHFTLIKQ